MNKKTEIEKYHEIFNQLKAHPDITVLHVQDKFAMDVYFKDKLITRIGAPFLDDTITDFWDKFSVKVAEK